MIKITWDRQLKEDWIVFLSQEIYNYLHINVLYTPPMNINGYSHSSYCFIPFLWTLMAIPIPHTVLYPSYEH